MVKFKKGICFSLSETKGGHINVIIMEGLANAKTK